MLPLKSNEGQGGDDKLRLGRQRQSLDGILLKEKNDIELEWYIIERQGQLLNETIA